MVNLEWVREHYFKSVADQVARIASPDGGIVFTVFDERHRPLIASYSNGTSPGLMSSPTPETQVRVPMRVTCTIKRRRRQTVEVS